MVVISAVERQKQDPRVESQMRQKQRIKSELCAAVKSVWGWNSTFLKLTHQFHFWISHARRPRILNSRTDGKHNTNTVPVWMRAEEGWVGILLVRLWDSLLGLLYLCVRVVPVMPPRLPVRNEPKKKKKKKGIKTSFGKNGAGVRCFPLNAADRKQRLLLRAARG